MGKRSRDASFSPAAVSSSASSRSETGSDLADERPEKFSLLDANTAAAATQAMQCTLPPHAEPVKFPSIEAFDVHYAKDHTNRCSSCGKNFPSAHFLALHLDENHNPLREALQARGEKTYACFVEDCDRKCSAPEKRRRHLIDKHMFPKSYNFRVVNQGIDRAASMLQEGQKRRISVTAQENSHGNRRRASTLTGPSGAAAASEQSRPVRLAKFKQVGRADLKRNSHSLVLPPNVCDKDGDKRLIEDSQDELEALEESMSALKFVPTSVVLRQSRKDGKK